MQLMAQDTPATNRCAFGGLCVLPAWQSSVSQSFSTANVLFAAFQPLDIPVLISTLPACPLVPSHSSMNGATEMKAE